MGEILVYRYDLSNTASLALACKMERDTGMDEMWYEYERLVCGCMSLLDSLNRHIHRGVVVIVER